MDICVTSEIVYANIPILQNLIEDFLGLLPVIETEEKVEEYNPCIYFHYLFTYYVEQMAKYTSEPDKSFIIRDALNPKKFTVHKYMFLEIYIKE